MKKWRSTPESRAKTKIWKAIAGTGTFKQRVHRLAGPCSAILAKVSADARSAQAASDPPPPQSSASMTPCLDCGRLTRIGPRCRAHELAHQSARNARRPQYRGDWPSRRSACITAQPWCTFCGHLGSRDNPLTADHVIPVANGGTRGPLRTLCRRCNSRRRAARYAGG